MDPTHLHQVVWNLCQNATCHAGREQAGFRLELKGSRREGSRRPQLDIIDNGTGIEPDMADKIFEPFFTTKERGRGTGLGLTITYGLVKKLNGNISVISKEMEGTTFNITLPIRMQEGLIKDEDSFGR